MERIKISEVDERFVCNKANNSLKASGPNSDVDMLFYNSKYGLSRLLSWKNIHKYASFKKIVLENVDLYKSFKR